MINIRRTTIMKKGTLLVVRKPYQGDTVIQNTLNYAIGSLFADEEDILTSYIDNEMTPIRLLKNITAYKHLII